MSDRLINSNKASGKVNVTILSSIKHAELYAAAKSMGSFGALAEHLEIQSQTLWQWSTFRSCPPKEPTHYWPKKRLKKLESRLFALTGKLLPELFPDSGRNNVEFRKNLKRFEFTKEIPMESLSVLALTMQDASATPEELADREDLKQRMSHAINHLDYRRREVVVRRYGLNGCQEETLEQIAKSMNVGKERVRQLELSALNKLRHEEKPRKILMPHTEQHEADREALRELLATPPKRSPLSTAKD